METRQYGLLLRKHTRHDTRRVDVYIVTRKDGADEYAAPLGVSDDSFLYERPKHLASLALDGLGMYGFASDLTDVPFIGDNLEYRDVFAVDGRKAEKMFRTLRKANALLHKRQAHEPGDKFQALADFIRADFVVEDRQNDLPKSGNRWRYMDVAEGRNRYRQLIDEVRQETSGKIAA